MRSFKKLGVLVAILALSAVGAANASAATFTASATGSVTGKALNTQVFTTNSGQVKCTTAETSGSIVSTASAEQHVTVNYKNCTAFGFASVDISPATYNFTAGGTVHLKETITINVTLAGCHQTVPGGQTFSGITYKNNSGKLIVEANVSGIKYKGTGGFCGSTTEQSNGTYVGNNETERVGGGTISWDA